MMFAISIVFFFFCDFDAFGRDLFFLMIFVISDCVFGLTILVISLRMFGDACGPDWNFVTWMMSGLIFTDFDDAGFDLFFRCW